MLKIFQPQWQASEVVSLVSDKHEDLWWDVWWSETLCAVFSGIHLFKDLSPMVWYWILVNFVQSIVKYIFCVYLDWIHPSAVVLSVQMCFELMTVVILHSQNQARSAPSVAASNSGFRKLGCLVGANLDLLITYCEVEDPLALIVLTHTMATNTLIDASVNTWSWWAPLMLGIKHLGIWIEVLLSESSIHSCRSC